MTYLSRRVNDRLAAMCRSVDSGATLVLALIFITVIAVTIAAVLSLANANIRATVELRKQAAQAAGAEAAAQIAIDKMRRSTYLSGTACFDGSSTLTLNNAYQSPDGSALPAVVTCAPDDATSFVSSFTRPGYALLALPDPNGAEAGISIHVNGSGQIHVGGNAATQSFIDAKGKMTVDGDFFAHVSTSDCTGSNVVVGPGKTKTCNAASIPNIPVYNPPTMKDNLHVFTYPADKKTCDKRIEFTEGIYPDLQLLTDAFSCNKAVVYDFRPGVYYFDYTGMWDIDQATVIGGKDTQIPTPSGNKAPSIPGACPDLTQVASPTPPAVDSGVTFVFGGRAQWTVSHTGQVELCGRWQAKTMPPVVVYGLTAPASNNTGQTVPALTGCLTSSNAVTRCPLFQTAQHTKDIAFHLQGLSYAPTAWFDLDERDSTLQYFNDGLIARAVDVFAPASATVPTPFANLPISLPGPSWSVVNLTVAVCPGLATCTPGTGTVRLKAKIGILDPTGVPATNGNRQAKVYTWSVQR